MPKRASEVLHELSPRLERKGLHALSSTTSCLAVIFDNIETALGDDVPHGFETWDDWEGHAMVCLMLAMPFQARYDVEELHQRMQVVLARLNAAG